jgi:hypothetical protein
MKQDVGGRGLLRDFDGYGYDRGWEWDVLLSLCAATNSPVMIAMVR